MNIPETVNFKCYMQYVVLLFIMNIYVNHLLRYQQHNTMLYRLHQYNIKM